MKLLIVTDAWEPQVNGVVRTLKQTRAQLELAGHRVEFLTPQAFRTVPCPTYPEIRLSLWPGRGVARAIETFLPDALHIATEGPLGLAARAHALREGKPFTSAYHTRFPEYIRARTGLPESVSYRFMRWFHEASTHVMVPTPAMQQELERWGFRNARVWSRGVDTELFSPGPADLLDDLPRPIFLNVGRAAVEKNIDAFLSLDLPGTKVFAGEGPALAGLRRRHPEARYFGVLSRQVLARLYRAADVFVFPSRTDTFGLVMLEAMACGVPVAAFPVEGPIDVVGESGAGVLDADLRTACLKALDIPRSIPRTHASRFTWEAATETFYSLLAPRTPRGGWSGPSVRPVAEPLAR